MVWGTTVLGDPDEILTNWEACEKAEPTRFDKYLTQQVRQALGKQAGPEPGKE